MKDGYSKLNLFKRSQLRKLAIPAFTIVELLIVIVIIGILATIVIVAYNGITTKARQATLQSDLSNSRSKIEVANATDGSYPSDSIVSTNKFSYLTESKGNTLTYYTNSSTTAFCVSAIGSDNITYAISNLSGTIKGYCGGDYNTVATASDGTPLPTPNYIQTITTANCPTTRTRVVDARDNHTYWVKKIGSLCWMMTNLAYGGGGNNTYGDVKGLVYSAGGKTERLFNVPVYYLPAITSPTVIYTTEPNDPSANTDGSGQYGYLYNWCAAMGGQETAACLNSSLTPTPITTITICPSGWRLPVGGTTGNEFAALNSTINSGSTSSNSGLLSGWLAQYAGVVDDGWIDYQGSEGDYWSSTQSPTMAFSQTLTYIMYHDSSNVGVDWDNYREYSFSVRCVAAI